MRLNPPPYVPDYDRAKNNLETFLNRNPEYFSKTKEYLHHITMLFSYSQFLANYCINHPESLFKAIESLEKEITEESLKSELNILLKDSSTIKEGMKTVRLFKKDKLLIITLKDILKLTSIEDNMYELSILADSIISESLWFVYNLAIKKFGEPEKNTLSLIGLGKLGSHELNYSSDVDIIFTYKEDGYTSGVTSLQGVNFNRLTIFEFYCKLIEEYCRFLSQNTEDGFVYRIDLRLRPQGQKGLLIMNLRGYEDYYESWGQLWERVSLIRARHIAGDPNTGNDFLELIRPFVYRKYLGFDAIEEIRRLKSQVEQFRPGIYSRDIKRGFGGIREIEFFVHIFQLIYGGKEPLLRDSRTLVTLHRLLQKSLIGHEDFIELSQNYLFLRTLEHRLQQLNDIQTHSLPTNEKDLDILARKMNFDDKVSFLSSLYSKRCRVRQIYDALLEANAKKTEKSTSTIGAKLMGNVFWEMDSPVESLMMEELSKTKLKDTKKAIYYLTKIRNSIYSFQTLRGRKLLEDLIPKFIDNALTGTNPDNALLQLVNFTSLLASRESYLEFLSNRQELISTLIFIFSNSEYLTRLLMSSPETLDSLVIDKLIPKTKKELLSELSLLFDKYGISSAVRLFKAYQEIRLGFLFLNRYISVIKLMIFLSQTAEIIIENLLNIHQQNLKNSNLLIIALGKLGGREITFNSDIDIVFMSINEPTVNNIKDAEKIIRTLSAYTKDGVCYHIDTRLRPEGSKGSLVNSKKGIENYYLKNAHLWELQAFLKARVISKDLQVIMDFNSLKEKIILKRAQEIKKDEVIKMCQRIQKELSKENTSNNSYDIKYGSGGLIELEFFIQFLQLKGCIENPRMLLPNTFSAINALKKSGLLIPNDAEKLKEIYRFYRKLETLLKLRNETVMKIDDNSTEGIKYFLSLTEETLINELTKSKDYVHKIWDNY
ncbi:MAG: bifunctional [glutamate--ammonia ligase]-adenylyl-L-tyrosine phosphorylase/[glutamate--ammonia-ligase] adenylyltransferase [Thermodesulfovibrionales bacterium]|nr:bifunctional [glutamate--ammonia ligase]-adenylyl-L-tyrosine phosphorylase/[glutamate--ammonia-ligase] adenylyltransferase [Thermodesulfovibrionales bacterium]